MKHFKGIIMSEYTSQLTILRHFPKIFSMIHIPPKPIASAGCDTCSWSRPIRTKSVFSRLVMFIQTKTSNKTVYYNKRNKLT